MLKKTNRLTSEEFDKYFQSGRRYHSPLLTLVYTPNDRFHGAVVVGKKVSKKAVTRNRLRRQLYALLYNFSKTSNQSGVYQLLTKPTALQADSESLKTELNSLLVKVARK